MSRSYQLYGYWRSSASWRVRWAMLLKKIPYESMPVNLLKGEHRDNAHLEINPAGLVPVLITPEGETLVQSMAILQYLEELYPRPSLFGRDSLEGAKIRGLCETINADTAPLQTPRVQKYHSPDSSQQIRWAQEWIYRGLKTFDALRPKSAAMSASDSVSAADLFLVPQIFNALRYQINVGTEFPELMRIYESCLATREGMESSPDNQPDATYA
jgi:maleylacetoacetate isomerase